MNLLPQYQLAPQAFRGRYRLEKWSGVESSKNLVTMIHSISLGKEAVAGGIESWISDFLHFSPRGYRVLGVFFDDADRIEAPWLKPSAEAHAIARLPRKRKLIPHVFRVAAGIWRHRALLTSRVIIHRLELAPLVRIVRPSCRITVVIHTNMRAQLGHGSDSLWRFLGPLYFFLESVFMSFADVVISHSIRDAPRLREKHPNLQLVPGWFNDRIFSVRDLASERSGILWVGRFERVKDPTLALRGFAYQQGLAEDNLTFVGNGSLQSELASEIGKMGLENSVIIQEPLSATELSEVMNRNRLLLHTSHFEGSSRVIIEALACGLAVVTLPECDPDGWIARTGCGIYARRRSSAAINDALLAAPRLDPRKISESIQHRAASRVVPTIEKLVFGS